MKKLAAQNVSIFCNKRKLDKTLFSIAPDPNIACVAKDQRQKETDLKSDISRCDNDDSIERLSLALGKGRRGDTRQNSFLDPNTAV